MKMFHDQSRLIDDATMAILDEDNSKGTNSEEVAHRAAERGNELVLDYIKSLQKEAERYQHLFLTENGSFYCVLKTGESMRVKAFSKEYRKPFPFGVGSFNPLMRGIVFLDPADFAKKKQELRNLEYKESITLETVPLSAGVIPFEYEPLEWHGRRDAKGIVEWDKSHSRITLKGWEDKQGSNPSDNFNGYPTHTGHPVVRVVK